MATNHLDRLQAIRAEYPALINAGQAVEILNRLAWEFRAEGFGLLRKDNGNHAAQTGSIVLCSADWLVNSQTGLGGDCLIAGPDATIGELGKATPTWNQNEPFDTSHFVHPTGPFIVNEPPPKDEHETEPAGELERLVSVLDARISALQEDLTDLVKGELAAALAILKAQEYTASNRYLGTITIRPKQ